MMTASPIRIVHLLPTFADRGAQRIAAWIIADLDWSRFEPSVASLRAEGTGRHLFSSLGVDTADFGTRRFLFADPVAAARLVRYLRSRRIDIVHTHGVRDGIYGRICARLAGSPVVVSSIHNKWGSSIHHRLDGATMRLADMVLPFSGAAARFARDQLGVPGEKIRIVYFGIETQRFADVPATARPRIRAELGVSPDQVLVGSLGALTDQKGYDFLVEALPDVVGTYPEARFVVAGHGHRRQRLEQRARALGVADRIRFVGHRDDVPEFLSALDLFVLPSRWEGLPIAAVEAMAAGCPVVLSRVDGNAELISHGETGYLVEPNCPASLARGIDAALRSPRERATVARRGQAAVLGTFSRRRMGAEFTQIYELLLRQKRGGRRASSIWPAGDGRTLPRLEGAPR